MELNFEELKQLMKFTSLEKDLVLLEDFSIVPYHDKPEVIETGIFMIISSGSIDIGINLNRYTIPAPALLTIMPGQIIQYYGKSDDFAGMTTSSSHQFNDFLEINIEKALPLFFRLKEIPFIRLKESELDILSENFYLLKKIISHPNNIYRYEMAKHLTHVSFYMVLDIFTRSNMKEDKKKKTTQEDIFESFYRYVLVYYKQERGLQFYADKLCITPKYLSSVIKSTSGKSANDWIDSHVILEAKALLKSSKMTIQQISDKLNFPSQSFFGKYFKRHTGMSPKEYKAR